jgi:hypothetical protein
MKPEKFTRRNLWLAILCFLAPAFFPSTARAQGPVFAVEKEGSTVQFSVKASVAIVGKFDKWKATSATLCTSQKQTCRQLIRRDFWSLTMYDKEYFLVPNSINRYSLSSRDKFKTNQDGSMDLYIQKESPGADKQSNWLPSPDGEFILMLRL